MKVNELFEEQVTLMQAMKSINVGFKELANKFQLTLVAGMGWPNIVKDGAWMGGGLGPKRGIKDEDAALGIEKRRAGFLKALARQLEQLMKDGYTVKVGKGSSRSNGITVAEPGKVEALLNANLETDDPPGNVDRSPMPCVVWFVSAPPGISTAQLLHVQASLTPPNSFSGFGCYHTFTLPSSEIEKKLTKWYGKLHKQEEYFTNSQGLRQIRVTPEYRAFVVDYILNAQEAGLEVRDHTKEVHGKSALTLKQLAQNPGAKARTTFSKSRAHGKDTKLLDFNLILPVLKKHGFEH